MAYFDPNVALSDDEYYVDLASDILARLAPVPTPVPPATTVDPTTMADYAARAERGEKLLFDWLSNTQGGALNGASGAQGSVNFAQLKVVQDIVRQAMGTYFTAQSAVRIKRPRQSSNAIFWTTPYELRGPYWEYFQ